jgi:predicted nucleic acid-binding protein
VKYLVDTNVWLELLLDRDGADQVRRFFERTDAGALAISEFSL